MRKRSFAYWLVTIALSAVGAGIFLANAGGPAVSRVTRLEPDSGSPEDIVTAYGERLDSSRVGDVSLSGGNVQALVRIIQQEETLIRFRIPTMLTPGTYIVVIHPVGKYGDGVRQRVSLTVR